MTNAPIPAWARAWQRVLEWRIGIVPVPVFVLLSAMTWYFVAADKVVTDLPTMIAVVALFGFACAELIAALAPANLITIAATVMTVIGGGFFVARWVNLYPIEAAIVNATHAGQGGTGGVAILTAAERMQLMPFAQIAIRIGGAIVVTLTLLAFARLH